MDERTDHFNYLLDFFECAIIIKPKKTVRCRWPINWNVTILKRSLDLNVLEPFKTSPNPNKSMWKSEIVEPRPILWKVDFINLCGTADAELRCNWKSSMFLLVFGGPILSYRGSFRPKPWGSRPIQKSDPKTSNTWPQQECLCSIPLQIKNCWFIISNILEIYQTGSIKKTVYKEANGLCRFIGEIPAGITSNIQYHNLYILLYVIFHHQCIMYCIVDQGPIS